MPETYLSGKKKNNFFWRKVRINFLLLNFIESLIQIQIVLLKRTMKREISWELRFLIIKYFSQKKRMINYIYQIICVWLGSFFLGIKWLTMNYQTMMKLHEIWNTINLWMKEYIYKLFLFLNFFNIYFWCSHNF
jgi:hypothetical protein